MPRVEIRDNESLEKALRCFKRKIEREGMLKTLKERKHYEKPSDAVGEKDENSKTPFDIRYPV